jgi:microcin C transport system substrate-binding protein
MLLAARALTMFGAPSAISFAAAQAAAPGDWRHGLSLFGDLKYKADFKQFDYVNACAP